MLTQGLTDRQVQTLRDAAPPFPGLGLSSWPESTRGRRHPSTERRHFGMVERDICAMNNHPQGEQSDDLQKQLGDRLVEIRKTRGWSIDRVAKALSVSRATVGHWETGTRAIKSSDLARLCQVLQASADDLLFGARRWPFQHVSVEIVEALEPTEIAQLEGAMAAAADSLGIKLRPSFPQTTVAQTAAEKSSSYSLPAGKTDQRSKPDRRVSVRRKSA